MQKRSTSPAWTRSRSAKAEPQESGRNKLLGPRELEDAACKISPTAFFEVRRETRRGDEQGSGGRGVGICPSCATQRLGTRTPLAVSQPWERFGISFQSCGFGAAPLSQREGQKGGAGCTKESSRGGDPCTLAPSRGAGTDLGGPWHPLGGPSRGRSRPLGSAPSPPAVPAAAEVHPPAPRSAPRDPAAPAAEPAPLGTPTAPAAHLPLPWRGSLACWWRLSSACC